MLTTETKTHTFYIPTQRCAKCGSANTSVRLIPGKTKGHEPIPINKWTCNDCSTIFDPSEVPVTEPILICANCKDMVPHKFVRNAEVQHVPSPDDQPREPADTIHHHVISHMYSCLTCGTVRVYGCHLGTA